MGFVNKPLVEVCSRPMIEHVVSKLLALVDHTVIAMSSATEGVEYLCRGIESADCVYTSGVDYVEDLKFMVSALRKPILVAPADTPLIPLTILADFVERGMASRSSIATLVIRKEGMQVPLGVSLFRGDGSDWVNIVYDWRPELINVNTPDELREVERLCRNALEISWRFCTE